MDEVVLSDPDRSGEPVVRVGDTIRRPRTGGTELVSLLLQHLADARFDGAPRFLGYDDQDRQILSFVDGEVWPAPDWQHDDRLNARHLGRVAELVRRLHLATEGFDPPPDLAPLRPLPLPGPCWSHGDVGYQNVVYRRGQPVALIDWEFAAPADHLCDLAGLLALGVRGPRPHVEDNDRRAEAVALAHASIVSEADLANADAVRLWSAAAVVLDDAARYWSSIGTDPQRVAAARWRARWFADQ